MTSENNRCILLLQGPLSKYYARTAHHLEQLGAKTLKVHFCGSDVHDWEQTDSIHFAEPEENWELFLEALIVAHGVTDILLHGDRRYYHKVAIGVAKRLDVNIIATELGYLRPDWMTVEFGGCSALSHFPQSKQELMALETPAQEDSSAVVYPGSYKQIVLQELGFTFYNALHARKFPHYRNHRTEPRTQVYGGWLKARIQAKTRQQEAEVIWEQLKQSGTPYYLFALQLNGDFQIRTTPRLAASMRRLRKSSPPLHAMRRMGRCCCSKAIRWSTASRIFPAPSLRQAVNMGLRVGPSSFTGGRSKSWQNHPLAC